MAVRVEFYAENQIVASSIVEFALSAGAMLHSFNEVEPPLKKPVPTRGPGSNAGRIGGATGKRAKGYKLINSDNDFTKGSQRYMALEHLLRHATEGQVLTLKDMVALFVKKMKCPPAAARGFVKAMRDQENLEAQYG